MKLVAESGLIKVRADVVAWFLQAWFLLQFLGLDKRNVLTYILL